MVMESTMLVIDDNEMNREILKLLFSKEFAILEADDGKEALVVLESCQGNIDIVLMDLMMPEIDGFTLLQERRRLEYFKNVPVVVITSSGAIEDQVRAFELGASDFVNKPFVPEIVITRVNNVMASHRRMLSIELEAQKLKIKSELDQMTNLYNKTTSEMAIEKILRTQPNHLHALILIDIDNFKAVNDTSGHLAGDHVIRIVADLISSLFRKTDVVGRIGGDEFVAFMQCVPSADIVRSKVNELIQIMKYKPNLTIPENVSLSIGFVVQKGEGTPYEVLFEKADSALYMAKADGKARYQEYGVKNIQIAEDERPTILLLSRNRSVCSTIQALSPIGFRVMEALTVDDLRRFPKKDTQRLTVAYVDASDEEENADIWEALKDFDWISMENVFAICLEGNLKQYGRAMQAGVADILTAPLDGASFKRRTQRHLEKMGIPEERE